MVVLLTHNASGCSIWRTEGKYDNRLYPEGNFIRQNLSGHREFNIIFCLKSSCFFAMHLQILGLEVCADTVVGNAMLRGISGGQRKRVTTGKINLTSFLKGILFGYVKVDYIWQTINNYASINTGEMLVGPDKALFMDEISTGLDSSTTFQIVNSLKQYVHILKGTTVISLHTFWLSMRLGGS